MPFFIAQGRFTRDAVRGMIAAPEDRTEAVNKLMESVGGKLVSWYLTSGEYDWLLVVDAPDQEAAMTAAIVAAGGGGVTDAKTSIAFTGPQAKAMFEKAKSVSAAFRSAGQGT
jgi:uncharacterized protein with GYD domain